MIAAIGLIIFAFATAPLNDVPQTTPPDTKCSSCQPKAEESYWQRALKPDVFPVWLGGGAAFLASAVGLGVLFDTRRQTRAAIVAAGAAKKSADSQINIERPWLLFENLKTPRYTQISFDQSTKLTGFFKYKIHNYGKTPALVCALEMRFEKAAVGLFPDFPDAFNAADFAVNPYVIPQADNREDKVSLRPTSELTPIEDRSITDGSLALWAYGVVRYRDVHGGSYETRICYRYDPEAENLVMDGPLEYNRAT